MLFNMSAQLALEDCVEKRAHFGFFANRDQLDPAIAQVPNRTSYIKTFRNVPDRPAKAHALDIAFVKDLNGSAHASEDCCGFACAASAPRLIAPAAELVIPRGANLPAAESAGGRWN